MSISGGPFEPEVTVTIGGEIASVISNTGSIVTVQTPSFTGEGWASVRVANPDGLSLEVTNGFHFWMDGTGMAGALGMYRWYDIVGSYWSEPDPAGFGTASVFLHQPADLHVWDFFTDGVGLCVDSTYSSSHSIVPYDIGETRLTLQSPTSVRTVIPWDSDEGAFLNPDLVASNFETNRNYTLEAPTDSDSPLSETDLFVQTPGAFAVTIPSISGFEPPNITRSQLIQWTAGSADMVLIELLMYDFTATEIEQTVACVTADYGSFEIPYSAWTSWPTGRQVTVLVSKLNEATGTLDFNNSQSRMVGMYTVYGAGFSSY